MPSQAYFEVDGVGDWYDCVVATAPGESPVTAPEKWHKHEIPDVFERPVVEWALALLYGATGQSDKKRAQRQDAQDALDDVTFKHLASRGDFQRSEVLVR